jgi:hypothetical protein
MRRCALPASLLLALAACASRIKERGAPSVSTDATLDRGTLSGNFAGAWQTFTIDRNGRVSPQVSWVDTMTAVGPTEEIGRTYVTTTDAMTFSGGRIPAQRVVGREGYLRNSDGTFGDYFVETMGRTSRMTRVATNVLISVAPAAPGELGTLGPNASAEHVLVKVVSIESGTEIHRISRVTTVHWFDSSGIARSAQYVSLTGEHHRLAH